MKTTEQIKKELHEIVCKFKQWTAEHYPEMAEDRDNGEWEFDCPYFYDMCSVAAETIKNFSVAQIDEEMIDEILYCIARDEEDYFLIEILEEYPEWYSYLCRRSLKTGYRNAQLQFAVSLKDYQGSDDLKESIYAFLSAGDEYIERMALKSLAHIDPQQTEKYAVDFWDRNKYEQDEYQKIMVLHVLYEIQSKKLKDYLDWADQSDSTLLRNHAAEIRRKL